MDFSLLTIVNTYWCAARIRITTAINLSQCSISAFIYIGWIYYLYLSLYPKQHIITMFSIPGEYRRRASGWQLVPRNRVSGCGDCDGHLLVLPGKQVVQDHGILQEHGASVRYRHTWGRETDAARWGPGAWRHCWGQLVIFCVRSFGYYFILLFTNNLINKDWTT